MTIRFIFHWKMCSYIECSKKNCCRDTCFCDLNVQLIGVDTFPRGERTAREVLLGLATVWTSYYCSWLTS